MKQPTLPGFNAAYSLYKTTGQYRLGHSWENGGRDLGLTPQLTLSCPNKGCGPCVKDPTSSLGGRKCCCHVFDEFGLCDPVEVECRPVTQPPPPTCNCPAGSTCCDRNDCCPSGAHCCFDGHGCCKDGSQCRSICLPFLGCKFFCSPI